ncbi:hypothetical protein Nepgr_002743 [Nepenthes gracilis]|uniref:Uncharacterized protein n=1 Tax=Nepenthes gracilis TaxID=150966 RepID=A0AAD3RY08_NEPGR|nr:hypothetical protein Nepgr_002743 [Nepenthes gracilis]
MLGIGGKQIDSIDASASGPLETPTRRAGSSLPTSAPSYNMRSVEGDRAEANPLHDSLIACILSTVVRPSSVDEEEEELDKATHR